MSSSSVYLTARGVWAVVLLLVVCACSTESTESTTTDGSIDEQQTDLSAANIDVDLSSRDAEEGARDSGADVDSTQFDAAGPDATQADASKAVIDASLTRHDGHLDAARNAELCPPIESRPEPNLVNRFEDGGPEVEAVGEGFRVIAPEGHLALAQNAVAVLPNCHEAIAEHMGYCNPWREAIVHYGRFEPSRAKAEDGVVYIGTSEASLTRLDDSNVWAGLPTLCGGQATLAHESVHTFQPADLPAWLKEGWADYFSKVIVQGYTYECGETSVCIRPPNTGGRPQPEECPAPVEYWDLSDPNWGVRPDPDEKREGNGQSNKGRYYKTGTCFWQAIGDAYGADSLRSIFRTMHLEPRDDLPIFPFSLETNDLLMRTYFVPVVGPEVWGLVARFGVLPLE